MLFYLKELIPINPYFYIPVNVTKKLFIETFYRTFVFTKL